MLNVICVKWGDKYSDIWVHRLRAMVAKHLTVPHKFVCMTDKFIEHMHCVPCAPDLPTWWSKVGLFRPGLFPGANLYLDLDVVITENIDEMVKWNFHDGMVTAPDDFSYSLLHPKPGLGEFMQRQLGGPGTVNSSVMLWRGDDGRDIWDKFTPDKMEELHGDQNWISQCMWPDKLALLQGPWVCSYKYHVERGQPIAPVVVFHGNPKVTDLPTSHALKKAWAA